MNINTNKENLVYKSILKASSEYGDVGIIEQRAEDYYNEASYFYEKEDYSNVESNCRLARTSYADASQGYEQISSMLEELEIEDELIELRIKSYKVLVEIQWNMYEACEHFESAVRYYDFYYNTDVPYDDMSYDMGTGEIEMMNEKIRLHDENIRKYNQLLSDFNTKLEIRLNEN